MEKEGGFQPLTPQQARAIFARLYEDVCDGLEEQLQKAQCVELNEGDYSLGNDDLREIASIMQTRGYSAQLFQFAKSLGKATLIVGQLLLRPNNAREVF